MKIKVTYLIELRSPISANEKKQLVAHVDDAISDRIIDSSRCFDLIKRVDRKTAAKRPLNVFK